MASKKNNALNLSLGVDLDGFKKGFADAIKTTQGSTASIEKEAKDMAASLVASMKKVENSTTMKQASRNLQNMVGQMHAFGLEGTKAYNEVVKAGGRLKADLDDVQQAIEAARPDAPFKALSNTLGASAQAFAGLQGGMALFGAESEDLQKTLLKVQAAMAFSEGFKAIDGLQDGFKQLNLIIKQNPLIAGATVVAAVVGVLVAMTDSTIKLTDAQKANNEIAEKSIQLAAQEYGEVEALKSIILDETLSRETRDKAFSSLQQKYPDYLNNLSIEKSTIDELKTATDKLSDSILRRARVQAAMDKLTELGKQQLAVELARAELEKERFSGGGLDQAVFAQSIKARENFINATERQLQREIKIYADYIDKSGGFGVGGAAQKPTITTPKAKSGTSTMPTKKAQTPSWLLGGEGEFEGVKNQLFFVGIEAKNTAKEVDNLSTSFSGLESVSTNSVGTVSLQMLNLQAAALGVSDAFAVAGGVISNSMMKAAGDAATAFDAFKAEIVETIFKLAGMAMANAITGAIQSGTATGPLAAFTTPAFITAAIGGVTSAFAAAASFKPQGFADGGLIGGNSFTGDRLLAPVNSGEVVFNEGKQNGFMRAMDSFIGGGGGGQLVAKVSGKDLLFVLDRTKGGFNRG